MGTSELMSRRLGANLRAAVVNAVLEDCVVGVVVQVT